MANIYSGKHWETIQDPNESAKDPQFAIKSQLQIMCSMASICQARIWS